MSQATDTLAQQFAAQHSADVVGDMLKTIKYARRATWAILIGGMGCSYVHQGHFLDELGAGPFGWCLPLIFDTAMVTMLKISKTDGMAADAKKAARVVFGIVALASAFINAAAPGPIGVRVLFAFLVAVVIGVEWVAGRIRPDFEAIASQVTPAPAAPQTRKLDPQVAAERAAKARATRNRKAAEQAAARAAAQQRAVKAATTRKVRRDAAVQAELELMITDAADRLF